SSQERRFASPIFSVDSMDFLTWPLQTCQPYKHILETRAKSRDTDNFKVMHVSISHYCIDNFRGIFSIKLKLITCFLCLVYHGETAKLVKLFCRVAIKRDLDR